MTWAVCYRLNDQRDGDYNTYALVEDLTQLAPPDNCTGIEILRTSPATVAESVFHKVKARS